MNFPLQATFALEPASYYAHTQLKHEHIDAAALRTRLGLGVFHPRRGREGATRRGVVSTIEQLFPRHVFVRCSCYVKHGSWNKSPFHLCAKLLDDRIQLRKTLLYVRLMRSVRRWLTTWNRANA